MAPASDKFSAPGAVSYDSDTMHVGDGTWDFEKNTFLLPNLQGTNFDTMRYNGMGNRFSSFKEYHPIIKAHAVLGALIFLLFVPTAVMMARFYSRQPGYAVKYHAQLQIFSGVLLLPVFILGFFAVGPERNLSNPHHGIGVAIFVMFILQIVGGRLVRHITKVRSLRIVIHQWSGRAIGLLGIVQVPLGLTLYGSPKVLFILFALWMVFLVLVYFILSYRSEGRREMYMTGARSEAARTRLTESEYFSQAPQQHHSGMKKWLGPLAAGAGIWAFMNRKKHKDRDRDHSPARTRSSFSRSYGPEVLPSRRGSASYVDEKYSDAHPQKKSGGGFMKLLGGAAAAVGAGKLASSFMNRRDNRHDDEYSAVSTETPRRYRSGRGTNVRSDLSSEYTEDMTQTSLLPPSAHPAGVSHADSRDPRNPETPRASHTRRPSGRDYDDSDYSSYVSPSRRQQEERSGGGGIAKGILGGLGMGWLAKKLADRKAKKEDDRLRDEEDLRSGTQGSKFTGDGHPSPTRNSRRPLPRRQTGYGRDTALSDVTESSLETYSRIGGHGSVPPTQSGSTPAPIPVPGGHSRSRSRSGMGREHLEMPVMPDDPHGILHSELDGSQMTSDARPTRRASSRRRRAGDRAAAAAAARAGGLAEEEQSSRGDRDRYGSPHSQPVSVKLKVHDDRDRKVTLRRLTEEEARAARSLRSRADSETSLSALDSPSNGRHYRRDSSQRRAERSAEGRTEAEHLGPLSPPNPAFAKGRRGKDSAYYSGQPGPSGTSQMAGQTVSTLDSVGSHGTWSGASQSPSGPPDKGTDSAAADNRRRRRLERRRASSSRPSGTDMFD